MSAFPAARRHFASCASTNDEAAAWARAGAPHGALVTADAQTRGRGRMGRAWSSPVGEGLYLSLVLRPPLPPPSAPPLTLAVGLALLDAMRALGVRAQLKWPNDLLACEPNGARRKLAGVLTEMATSGARIEHVIVGIGINVGTREFPAELSEIATSLGRCVDQAPARDEVLAQILAAFDARYAAFIEHGAATTVAAWRAEVDFLGRRVSVRSGDERVDGIAEQLDDEGALHVRDDAGRDHRLWAGDVVL
jgi:BirA family biotin operon repressor/biotin-[acetyl-CoA-carboxylase] ligase